MEENSKEINNIQSVLDDIIFLDIETSTLNPNKGEILEIGAIKFKNNKISIFNTLIKNRKEIPLEVFSLCKGLNINDFENALDLNIAKEKLLEFIEDKVVICHNSIIIKEFFSVYIREFKNKIVDSMELAAILEPYHKEYTLDYLKKVTTNNPSKNKNRALEDTIDIVKIVNSLIMRLNKREEGTLEPLTFKVNSYLNKFGLNSWSWSTLIDNANINIDDKNIRYKDINENNLQRDIEKERNIFNKVHSKNERYEDLLKDKSIWASKPGFIYEFRPGQYELTKTIRETFRGNNGSANIACIEAPTGIGKSVGYLLPAILEARLKIGRAHV